MSRFADQLRIVMADEGDDEDFFHAGLLCSVRRCPYSGAWAGYVAVPSDHLLYGEDAVLHPDLEVHGGVTFSNRRAERGSLWWIGFDCWHLYDIQPLRVDEEFPHPFSSYRSKFYVERETRALAEQLAVMVDADD